MGKEQYIPKDWQQDVERHCLVMEISGELCARQSPDAEEEYKKSCREFESYLKSHFGSARDFGFYLRADARQKLSGAGIDSDIADSSRHWDIETDDFIKAAGRAKSLYERTYRDIIDGIAHKKAFGGGISFRL